MGYYKSVAEYDSSVDINILLSVTKVLAQLVDAQEEALISCEKTIARYTQILQEYDKMVYEANDNLNAYFKEMNKIRATPIYIPN